jgi:hypothetical protein
VLTVLGVRKSTRSGQQEIFLMSNFDEVSLEKLALFPDFKQLNLLLKKTNAGKMYAAARPNQNASDNLQFITHVCSFTDYLLFDGATLVLKSKNGKKKKSWRATSGMPDSTFLDQNKKDFGPIPEGQYLLRFDKTVDIKSSESLWDFAKWLIKSPSWGFIATPIEASDETQTFGRGDFYIHGGYFPGSKGCIDLMVDNGAFHTTMRLYKRNVRLVVKYPKI